MYIYCLYTFLLYLFGSVDFIYILWETLIICVFLNILFTFTLIHNSFYVFYKQFIYIYTRFYCKTQVVYYYQGFCYNACHACVTVYVIKH